MQSENTSTSSSHRSEQLSCREGLQHLKSREWNARGGEFHFSGSRLKLESRVQSVPMLSHYYRTQLSEPQKAIEIKKDLLCKVLYIISMKHPNFQFNSIFFWVPIEIFSNHFMFWLVLGFSNVSIYIWNKWIYKCVKLCFKKWSCFLMDCEEKFFFPQ